MGGATLGLACLVCIRKVAGLARGSKPVSSSPPWELLGRTRRCDLAEGACHWKGFEFSKAHTIPSYLSAS